MKHPREEEVVSLALSLSTESSTVSTGSSAGNGGESPANSKRARIARRRRGPLVATSGEGDFVCKTCGRAFPSFQALGGHRTSHLRGRGAHGRLELGVVGAKALKQHKMLHQQQQEADSRSGRADNKQQQKHECHICGLGFEMGQALGGHMRRHREEMAAGGGGADDWVWRTTQLNEMPVRADPPVLLELFA